MKYRKIILITSLLSLFLINNQIQGQSKSKEALGNSLVESILSKNIDHFKALLLPQKVVLKLVENNAPENITKEERDSLKAQSEASYKNVFIFVNILYFVSRILLLKYLSNCESV